ncbi:putative membrane protein [Clavibacter michiganensis]|uniref:pilus assembly protein TadG-related protein n=1 Tax=Clavibacter michiganensis TaxID=28447 RepID=UPI001AE837BC|nr:pilus assembly protein TadG-related protein [Clavibacter michiganensis]MBP2458001.1 putative membrane protein [Clavibacter michiganensis]MDQ0410571.1 putative membrane protein [Clavibacter michiganensis]
MTGRRSRPGRGRAAIVGIDGAGDDGSILPLVIASCALGLAVILMVSAASSLYLQRVRLFSLADAAALAGAESFDVDGDGASPAPIAVDDGGVALPPLTDDGVAATVAAFLADEPTAGIHDLHVDGATTPDGRSARVTLSATWIPPVASLFAPDGVRIDVTSTARSVLVGPGAAPVGPAGGG